MKVFFDTVGCRLNQAEIEQLAGEFRAAGHTIIETADGADLVVLNTCAVTAAAASDSRQKVRQAQRAGARQIVITGCLATLEPAESGALPGVSLVIPNAEKSRIPAILSERAELFELEPLARQPLPGARKRTRAFIKAQDGCNNFCTFCVTRVARGGAVSVPKEKVLQEVAAAVAGGTREVVLTGVHLGSWGWGMDGNASLTELITFILENTSIERLRLSSTEPWDLEDRFFALWQNARMCRHLHLPLQSGYAGVLKRMARRTTPAEFRALILKARELIPGLAVTTDIIVGFPGETEEEFRESLEFVKEIGFSGGHVFKYSARPGTAAEKLPGRIHGSVARIRGQLMRNALTESAAQYTRNHIGMELAVLWETATLQEDGSWELHGFSDNYLQVKMSSDTDRENQIDRVKIQAYDGMVLTAIRLE